MSARIVVAGTSSGAGKTSITCGLIGALKARGHVVQGAKVGPDYIDPSYHQMASGRPGRNLDAFMAGPDLIAPLLLHGSAGADITIIEGVMGMFDGASGRGELASTAHIAKLTASPVVLVVDATAMSRSAAAIVLGFKSFDPDVQIAGVILNRVGSEHHEALLRDAIEPLGVPVVGAVRRSERFETPERHLGLVPAPEREAEARRALDALAGAVAEQVELDTLVRLAKTAPPLPVEPWAPPVAEGPKVRIAVAAGHAFSFHYRENVESLESVGVELVPFDPSHDTALPEAVDGLMLAGGFPEVYAEALTGNTPLRRQVAAAVRGGLPTVAECGGLLYLCEELDGHPMCGVVPGKARMAGRLSLGYREAVAESDSPIAAKGDVLRGHEFHYSTVDPSCGPAPAWTLRARGRERPEGFTTPTLSASYLHLHWGAFPDVPLRLAAAARARVAV
ncbi:MAG: cobyrinate a,c-diamide synthase [Solirubrobacteraceae bacterium]|nr:cobyrinate a,c-diamide synthase [Solirubrobacteraceae bacterium]